jgi:hypothetical protein
MFSSSIREDEKATTTALIHMARVVVLPDLPSFPLFLQCRLADNNDC